MSRLLVSRPLGAGVGRVTDLQVPMHHPHLVAVQHGLQDLLDAVTGEREGGAGGEGRPPLGGPRRECPAPRRPSQAAPLTHLASASL